MTPALFWTLVLAAAALLAVVLLARRLSSLPDRGSDSITKRLAMWRDRVVGSRPVNLDTWPETLAGQALRAARPVPGGRLLAPHYRVRCGAGLYGAASPHATELEKAFVRVLVGCARPEDLPDGVRIRFVYDGGLAREAYRLEPEVLRGSPTDTPSGTVLHVDPRADEPARPAGIAEDDTLVVLPLSWWTLVLPDGSRHRLPEDATTEVGAAGTCDLVVPEAHVSGRHLRAVVSERGLELHDGAETDDGHRPSRNGTFLNGHAVHRIDVEPGQTPAALRLGPNVELRIEYVDPFATMPMLDADLVVRPGASRR